MTVLELRCSTLFLVCVASCTSREPPPASSGQAVAIATFRAQAPATVEVYEPSSPGEVPTYRILVSSAIGGDEHLSLALPLAGRRTQSLDLAGPRPLKIGRQFTYEKNGVRHVARSGRVTVDFRPNLGYALLFDVLVTDPESKGVAHRLTGDVEGGWKLACHVYRGDQTWELDSKLDTRFCAARYGEIRQ